MKFKEHIIEDINNTFVNANEFAEEKNINGVNVLVVEDSDELEHRIKANYNGLIIGDVLFFISFSEYKKIPRVNKTPTSNMAIRYDGIPSTVIQVNKMDGMWEIVLQMAGGR